MGKLNVGEKHEILARLAEAVINRDENAAKKWAEKAISAKIDPVEAIQEGLARGLTIVGEKWKKLELFLPEVILASDVMKSAVEILKTQIKQNTEIKRGKIVIGTVYGDIHDIGKNLVCTMLTVAGYEIIDLGADVEPAKFIEVAKKHNAEIIALSCLVSPSLEYQRDVIKLLEELNLREKYAVIVGGGAVTPEWAREIKADGYGRLATHAVEVVETLLKGGKKAIPIIKT